MAAYQWPAPTLADGRRPVITNEYSPPAHPGVDVMYVRASGDPPGRGNERYDVPAGTPALAARAGVVRIAASWSRGHAVQIVHDDGRYTNYLHLENLEVSEGQRVAAGARLGRIGADPTDPEGLPHLHFELRLDDAAHTPLDPTPFLAGAASSPAPLLALALLALLALAVFA